MEASVEVDNFFQHVENGTPNFFLLEIPINEETIPYLSDVININFLRKIVNYDVTKHNMEENDYLIHVSIKFMTSPLV